MHNKITLRAVATARDIARFWQRADDMLLHDVLPNCDIDAPMTKEGAACFLSADYRKRIDGMCLREIDPLRRVFFLLDGQEIGFALYCVFGSEDGKCFVLDFCINAELRGRGLGTACFAALRQRAEAEGAAYFELNTYCRRAKRFWESLGFGYNGYDDWGTILLCRPPEQALPCTVERLTDLSDPWQLRKLENGFLHEIGEGVLDDARMARLVDAVAQERIAFFLAKRGYRAVGMCSVSPCFSTLACTSIGVFDDFFVEPVFRRQGAAHLLAAAAQEWCRARGFASLTVGASEGDVAMYRALGFSVPLGQMLACPLS